MSSEAETYLRSVLNLQRAAKTENGTAVTKELSFLAKNFGSLPDYTSLMNSCSPLTVMKEDGTWLENVDQWAAIISAYFRLLGGLKKLTLLPAIKESMEMVNQVSKIAQRQGKWICYPMKVVTNELRKLVFMYLQTGKTLDTEFLDKVSNTFQKPFKVCLSDKSDEKKSYVYFFANELFKTYMKFHQYDAAENLCKVLEHSPNLAPIEMTSKSQAVTYLYYTSLLECMRFGHLHKATKDLTRALDMCKKDRLSNQQCILVLLIPLNLLVSGKIPSRTLWKQYDTLNFAFRGILSAIREGNLKAFDSEIAKLQTLLLKRHIYSLYVRIRPLVELQLFRKVCRIYAEKAERKHIVPIGLFVKALNYSSERDEKYTQEEVESRLASLIYDGAIKGYISHGNAVIVLSKKNAFPKKS